MYLTEFPDPGRWVLDNVPLFQACYTIHHTLSQFATANSNCEFEERKLFYKHLFILSKPSLDSEVPNDSSCCMKGKPPK